MAVTKTVVVLGNARSGTSMVAGILQRLGVDMGGRVNPNPFCPGGDYENLEAHDINTLIFRLAGAKGKGELHYNPPTLDRILELRGNTEVETRIKNFVDRKKGTIWGWKNPKTTMTIWLYMPFLENPHFVVCVRNPEDTAKSAQKAFGIEYDKALEVGIIYDDALSRFLEAHCDYPVIVVNYEDSRSNPIGVSKRLADFIRLTLSFSAEKSIKEFIKN